jgi:GNAT superfamily N-acetyltransferase
MSTPAPAITLRAATAADTPRILAFIRALAEYERLLDRVVATEAGLRDALFGPRPYAEVVLAEEAGEPVGFALFFHTFSTFLGQPGIYLEDLFVLPSARGRGVGRALLAHLAGLAVERRCGRVEWAVLNWNEPAIRFYRSVGATPNDEWTVYRLAGEPLATLAAARSTSSG